MSEKTAKKLIEIVSRVAIRRTENKFRTSITNKQRAKYLPSINQNNLYPKGRGVKFKLAHNHECNDYVLEKKVDGKAKLTQLVLLQRV